jgi:hypothetical protein
MMITAKIMFFPSDKCSTILLNKAVFVGETRCQINIAYRNTDIILTNYILRTANIRLI